MPSTEDPSVFSFGKLLESGKHSDLTLIVGAEKKVFKVHSLILSTHAHFFEAVGRGNFKESKSNIVHVPEVNSDTMKYVLNFLYTGEYSLKTTSWETDFDVLLTSMYLCIESLKIFTTKGILKLMTNRGGASIQNGNKWIRMIYSRTSRPDRNYDLFKEMLKAILKPKLQEFLEDDEFQNLLSIYDELAFEVLMWCR